MTHRKYSGNPLDGRVQYITERPKKGCETTTVSDGDLSETQEEIVRLSITRPGLTQDEIADRVGCNRWWVTQTLKQRKEGKKEGSYRRQDELDELSDLARAIVLAVRNNPDINRTELAEELGCSRGFVYQVIHHNKHLIETEDP